MAKGCPRCDKIFDKMNHKRGNSYSYFKKHISQPHQKMKCKNCSETFDDKKSHDEHILKAHEQQPILCSLCSQPFYSKKELIRHRKEGKHRVELFIC